MLQPVFTSFSFSCAERVIIAPAASRAQAVSNNFFIFVNVLVDSKNKYNKSFEISIKIESAWAFVPHLFFPLSSSSTDKEVCGEVLLLEENQTNSPE